MRDKFMAMLREYGAVEVSSKKHVVYKLPNGRTLSVSHRFQHETQWKRAICQLRRAAKAQ